MPNHVSKNIQIFLDLKGFFFFLFLTVYDEKSGFIILSRVSN